MAARPTRKASQLFCVAKAAANTRRQRRNRAIHQPSQAGLHDLQHEQPAAGLVLFALDVGGAACLFESSARFSCERSSCGQVVEQLADAGVLRAGRGPFIKSAALHFHRRGLLADRVESQRPHQPDRAPLHEAVNVLPADQRNVVAELRLVQFDQTAAVCGFLLAHAVEDRGRSGEILAQPLGEVGVDAFVFFLQGDRQGQDFTFCETVEVFHLIRDRVLSLIILLGVEDEGWGDARQR